MVTEEQDYNRLVPLRTYLDATDAQLFKTYLEANGVKVFLVGEHIAAMNEGLKTDILVRVIDKVRAESALKSIEGMSCHEQHKLRDDGGVPDEDEYACRQCGSTYVSGYEGRVPTLIPGLYLSAKMGGNWMHCQQCDSYYREGKRRFASLSVALYWALTMAGITMFLLWFIEVVRWL